MSPFVYRYRNCRAPASTSTSVRALVAMGATAAPSGGRGSSRKCRCVCGAVIVALVAVVTAIVVNAPPTSTYVSLPPLMRAINAAGDVLDAVGIDPAPVDYESVIAAAVAAAGGLTDVDIPGWGCECAVSDSAAQPHCTPSGCVSHGTLDDGAMASLRVLTDELVARVKAGEVTFMGRLMLRDGMVRALANRLQVRGVIGARTSWARVSMHQQVSSAHCHAHHAELTWGLALTLVVVVGVGGGGLRLSTC